MRVNPHLTSFLSMWLMFFMLFYNFYFIRMLVTGGMWETDAIINHRAIFKDEAMPEEHTVVTSKITVEETLYPREVSANPTFLSQLTTTTPAPTFITTYWCLSYTTLTTTNPTGVITTGTTTWVQISFTQSYFQPTTPPSPPSGSIGMGSLSGTVGLVRETGFDGVKEPGVLKGAAGRLSGCERGKLVMLLMLVVVVGGLY